MGKQLCEYKFCMKEATTKGFVLARQLDNTHKPEPVWACELHKKVSGFFEENKKEEISMDQINVYLIDDGEQHWIAATTAKKAVEFYLNDYIDEADYEDHVEHGWSIEKLSEEEASKVVALHTENPESCDGYEMTSWKTIAEECYKGAPIVIGCSVIS